MLPLSHFLEIGKTESPTFPTTVAIWVWVFHSWVLPAFISTVKFPFCLQRAGEANVSLFGLTLKSAAPGDLGVHHTSKAGPGK